MPDHDKLFEAVRNADMQAVNDLLAADRSLAGAVDEEGHTPLHKAAQWLGTVWLLDLALSHGLVPPDRRESSIATLQSLPSADRYQQLVLGLLDLGIPVDVRGSDGATPLHACAAVNAWNAAELLLSGGANIEARDDEGGTPLHWAVRELDNPGFAMSLVERGADVNARSNNGMTPLHWAALGGKTDTVAELLDAGADINSVDYEPTCGSPLAYAVACDDQAAGLRTLRLLLDRGADLNAGKSRALDRAVLVGNTAAIDFLLPHSGGVNSRNRSQLTPLHLAAVNGGLEMAQFLLDRGANPNLIAGSSGTPADLARQMGQQDVAELLQSRAGPDESTPAPVVNLDDHRHTMEALWPAIETNPIALTNDTFLRDLDAHMQKLEALLLDQLRWLQGQGYSNADAMWRAMHDDQDQVTVVASANSDAMTELISGTGTRVLTASSELVQSERCSVQDLVRVNRIMERAMCTAVSYFPNPSRYAILGDFKLRLARAGVAGHTPLDAAQWFRHAIELDPDDPSSEIARRRLRSIAENPANQTAAEPQQKKPGWLHRLRLLR